MTAFNAGDIAFLYPYFDCKLFLGKPTFKSSTFNCSPIIKTSQLLSNSLRPSVPGPPKSSVIKYSNGYIPLLLIRLYSLFFSYFTLLIFLFKIVCNIFLTNFQKRLQFLNTLLVFLRIVLFQLCNILYFPLYRWIVA